LFIESMHLNKMKKYKVKNYYFAINFLVNLGYLSLLIYWKYHIKKSHFTFNTYYISNNVVICVRFFLYIQFQGTQLTIYKVNIFPLFVILDILVIKYILFRYYNIKQNVSMVM